MNKGLAIGVAIGIAIAAIAGVYAFFGIQSDESPKETTVGLSEKAEVTVETPSEVEKPSEEGEEKMGIKDVAEVEVEDPESYSVSGEETIGFKTESP